MSAPWHHAVSAAKHWGGKPEDYLEISVFMDSSKSAYPSNFHRILFHHSFGCSVIIPRVFGHYITNSDGKQISTKDIAERHVLEDYGQKFIPSFQDYLEHLTMPEWVNNGRHGLPASAKPLYKNVQPSEESVETLKAFTKD